MAGPVQQSGAMVPCPECATEVMQKEMIPIGLVDGQVQYLCVPCARKLLRTAPAD
jgi:DNA-directed RNA polymerase subunit RPC12/RpoP